MIYLDNAATSPVFPHILEKLEHWNREFFANPNSVHPEGQKSRREIDRVRRFLSQVVSSGEENIIFVSGATEANNTVIKGLAERHKNRKRILISPIEHKSVLVPVKELVKKGFSVEFLKVDSEGVVDIDHLKKRIDKDVLFVGVMHVNNETGVVQDVKVIGEICRSKGVPFFSDIVQSFGRLEVPYDYIDFFTTSGHKINAPKATGFMKISQEYPLHPLITGGGQEFGIRAGTENTPGIIAFGEAVKTWEENRQAFIDRFRELEKLFIGKLKEVIPDIKVVSEGKKVPYITTVLFPGVKGHDMVIALGRRGIAVSSGSACSSGSPMPSHVLTACGFSEDDALSGVRFSFGVDTDAAWLETAVEEIGEIYRKLSSFPF
ncbi:cysteine desulfurase family protein [Persephonella sp.]